MKNILTVLVVSFSLFVFAVEGEITAPTPDADLPTGTITKPTKKQIKSVKKPKKDDAQKSEEKK